MRTPGVKYVGVLEDPNDQLSFTTIVASETGRDSWVLDLRLDLANHSPTGFSWGYAGSGPHQTALAILADFLQDDYCAKYAYTWFAQNYVSRFPQDKGFVITGGDLLTALDDMPCRDIHRITVADVMEIKHYLVTEVQRNAAKAATHALMYS